MSHDFIIEPKIHDPSETLLSCSGYSVRTIVSPEDLEEAYRMRYEVFCRRLGWVEGGPDGLERDRYDRTAVSFGVYDGQGGLVAYVRLVMPRGRFMLEDVFSRSLGPETIVRKEPDTAEVSRLCHRPVRCREEDARRLTMLLFGGLYTWCAARGIRFLYAVTEEKAFRLYRMRGLPFRLMGEPMRMPDGIVARVAVLDWREFENSEEVSVSAETGY